MNGRPRQQLVGELVHGRATDASTDRLDDLPSNHAGRRIDDGAARREFEADDPFAAESGHAAGLAGDVDGSLEPRILHVLHHADAVACVPSRRHPDPHAGECLRNLALGQRLDEGKFARVQRTAQAR